MDHAWIHINHDWSTQICLRLRTLIMSSGKTSLPLKTALLSRYIRPSARQGERIASNTKENDVEWHLRIVSSSLKQLLLNRQDNPLVALQPRRLLLLCFPPLHLILSCLANHPLPTTTLFEASTLDIYHLYTLDVHLVCLCELLKGLLMWEAMWRSVHFCPNGALDHSLMLNPVT